MLRHVWYGLSSGLIAGLLVGLLESIGILAGINTGEYAALLFASVLYSLLGAAVGSAVGALLALLYLVRKISDPLSWALGFTVVFIGQLWTVLRSLVLRLVNNGRPLEPSAEAALAVGCLGAAIVLVWLITILVQRTPLKIIRLPRGTAALYGVVLVLAAVFSLAPGRILPELEKFQPPDLHEHPNVLLIVIDGLRVDRIGAYTGGRSQTPVLDQLAREGVLFEQVFSSASWTRPAMAALMTSNAPSVHGTSQRGARLADGAQTLSEVMSSRSYLTLGVPNSPDVARAFNFQQGFDRFDYQPAGLLPFESESIQRLAVYRQLQLFHVRMGWPQPVDAYYRPAEVILDRARDLIEASGEQRWFLWAHLMETTPPYFHQPQTMHPSLLPGVLPTPQQLPDIKNMYDAEVRWVDARLGDTIRWLEASGRLEETVVIVTASHGAELMDHGGWGAGESLYDEVIHVPLIVRLPNSRYAGTRAGWQVRLIDIAPTIATLVGGDVPDTWHGADLFEPAFEAWRDGEVPPPSERIVFAETVYRGVSMEAIRTEGWKFIRTGSGHPRGLWAEELYRIVEDPQEHHLLSGQEGTVQARLSQQLREIHEQMIGMDAGGGDAP